MVVLRCEQRKWAVAIAMAFLVAASTTSFGAAVDYFLKIEGISGESTDGGHQGWIDVMSFSWGASKPASLGSTQAGRASFGDIMIVKPVDKSSPRLYLACAAGQQFSTATLQGTRLVSGGLALLRVVYYEITLTNVIVSSIKPGNMNTSGTYPTEMVSMNFGKIRWTYRQYSPTGQLVAVIITSWNLLTGGMSAVLPELQQLE